MVKPAFLSDWPCTLSATIMAEPVPHFRRAFLLHSFQLSAYNFLLVVLLNLRFIQLLWYALWYTANRYPHFFFFAKNESIIRLYDNLQLSEEVFKVKCNCETQITYKVPTLDNIYNNIYSKYILKTCSPAICKKKVYY